MDKEKAEGLVKSLILYARDVGYYTGRNEVGSVRYRQAIKWQDELRDEIISYLAGEEEINPMTIKCGDCGQVLRAGEFGGEMYVDLCPTCTKKIKEEAELA